MSEVVVDVNFQDGEIDFTAELMQAMWEPSRLLPYPVDNTFSFAYKEQRYGIVDLLCFMDELQADLRAQGPEKMIEAILELINSVYIGDESFVLIGRCVDLYGVELDNRAGIVFRTLVCNGKMEVEQMLLIREVAKTLFPIPSPE